MGEYRFRALGALDLAIFIFHVIIGLLRDVPFIILLKSAVILLIYLPLIPLEIIHDLYRPDSPITMNLLQRFIFKLVRLAFTSFDYRIGRVFFSRTASFPLMLRRFGGRHIFDTYCAHVDTMVDGRRLEGWWLAPAGQAQHLSQGLQPPLNNGDKPWTMVHFHGGGFLMGSPTFYLEFLHNLRLSIAQKHGMQNTAIFAPVYPLSPEAPWAVRSDMARTAWMYLAAHKSVDHKKMIVSGDSAGGALALGLQMMLGAKQASGPYRGLPSPARMILISPYISLSEPLNSNSTFYRNDPFDYVNSLTLNKFAQLSSGAQTSLDRSNIIEFLADKVRPLIAPVASQFSTHLLSLLVSNRFVVDHAAEDTKSRHARLCEDNILLSPGDHLHLLESPSMPICPTLVCYGEGEILADQSRSLEVLAASGRFRLDITTVSKPTVHCWPLVLFHLGKDDDERAGALADISEWLGSPQSR